MARATEGPAAKPIAEIEPTEGELYDIGLADTDLNEGIKKKLKGKVAFIVRGKVPFIEKLKRAEAAGAIGAVVYNNEPGKPIPMGGDGKVEIPAIMISQALGLELKKEMASGPIRIQFKTGEKIEEPEIVDTITGFSSKGPRSEDNLLKPEIAAPGARVISAAMGQGHGSVQMDGTSMSAPHMAGVMALLKQARRDLNANELKSLVMNTSKALTTAPITLQGAGRVSDST
ncbi:MAG: S8 family serine peptidase, partial [Calothrix sp. SM1_5_4]|nr:S8 family serine peptidase [Calothrix sp. SM1_5_4]